MNDTLVQILDVQEKRSERHYLLICDMQDRQEALEDYLGIEFRGKKQAKKKFIKRK
jgi:hypothetical protein